MPQNSITWIKNTHVLLFMLDVLAKHNRHENISTIIMRYKGYIPYNSSTV